MAKGRDSGTIRVVGGFQVPRMQHVSGTEGGGERGAQIPSMPPAPSQGGGSSTQDSGSDTSSTDNSGGSETSGDS